TSSCLAFDGKGTEISFNPSGSGFTSTALVDGSSNGILAAACPSSSQCVALDSAGNQISFAPGGKGTPVLVDPSKQLTGLACPAGAPCVAVNGSGQGFPFSPGSTTT